MSPEQFGDLVFLTQTDTTIGFVSQNAQKLTRIKQRPPFKYYIRAVNSFRTLKQFTRVPALHKKRLRRSRKTTFIMPDGHSYRIVDDSRHLLLLDRLKWAYTTSANLSGHPYNENFAKDAADIIVSPLCQNSKASHIYRLNNQKLKRIR